MLGDSKIALVVGDVTGHGITATADMALIRGMVSALLHSGVAPSRVFGEVSGVLAQRTALLLATAADTPAQDDVVILLVETVPEHPRRWADERSARGRQEVGQDGLRRSGAHPARLLSDPKPRLHVRIAEWGNSSA